jgi:glucose-6-phosphate isomerase
MSKTGRTNEEARDALEHADWVVARAVEELSREG